MIYNAKILQKNCDWYEGDLLLEIRGKPLSCYYQVTDTNAHHYFTVGTELPVDLWFSLTKVLEVRQEFMPFIPFGTHQTDGLLSGRIETILSDETFRMNCGALMFDVQLRHPVSYLPGTNLLLNGSRQIFFPGTEWCYENIGCL